MNVSIVIPRKIASAYHVVCSKLCKELDLSQTAFDILMFFGNNPEYKTASDIVEVRCIKANLVSVNVEKLVNDGYLMRGKVKGDRRKTQLLCTDKSVAVIEQGRKLQKNFIERLFDGIDEETRKMLVSALVVMENNLNKILDEE